MCTRSWAYQKMTKNHDPWRCFSRLFIPGAIVAIVVSIPTLSQVFLYYRYSLHNWYYYYNSSIPTHHYSIYFPTPMYYSYLEPKWGPLFWLEKSGLVGGVFSLRKIEVYVYHHLPCLFQASLAPKTHSNFFGWKTGKPSWRGNWPEKPSRFPSVFLL